MASYLAELTRNLDVVLLNTAQRFDNHEDFPQGADGTRAHHRAHDGPGAQPDGADRSDPARPGVRRHLRRLLVSGSALRHGHLAFYSHPNGFRFDHLEVAKRVFPASDAAPSPSWISGPWIPCGSDWLAPCRCAAAARGEQPARRRDQPRVQAGAACGLEGAARAEAVDRGRQGRLARAAAPGGERSRRVRQPGQGRVPSPAPAAAAASRHRSQMREQRQFYRTEWSFEHELEAVVARGRRLVVGPWLSEVGFEALYWVPFLHWLKSGVPRRSRSRRGCLARRRRRLVRGRGGPLRGDLGSHRPGRVRPPQRRSAAPPSSFEASDLDREILDHVARQIGTPRFRRASTRV